MEARAIEIQSKKDRRLTIRVIPGHFATNHSHINYYVDLTGIKSQQMAAKRAGQCLAGEYANKPVDTVICLDGTEIVGAFLADALAKIGSHTLSEGSNINVITPELNSNNQMIFRDNIQNMVWGKSILLLLPSVTTGKSISRSLECIKYYGGKIQGIGAVFSAISSQNGVPVVSLFTGDDLPDYRTWTYSECPFCRENQKIDAIVNSYGYSKI